MKLTKTEIVAIRITGWFVFSWVVATWLTLTFLGLKDVAGIIAGWS